MLRGPPPRPAAGSSPAAEDVEATAAEAAAPPARFPILAGRGPPSSRSGATLLREATAAAREPWSGMWPRCRRRERLWAQGSGSRRGSGSVRAWERECQSQPRHRHCLQPERRGRGSGTAGGHTGNGQGLWAPALASEGRGGAQGPPPPCQHLGRPPAPCSPWTP